MASTRACAMNTSSGFNERQSRWYRDAIHVPSRSQLGIWRRPCGHFLGAGGRRAAFRGCMLCTSLPFPPLPTLLSPLSPKASEHTRPRREKKIPAHSRFFCWSSPLPRPPSAFPPRPDQSVPAAGGPSPQGCRQTTGHRRPALLPGIYPSGPWRGSSQWGQRRDGLGQQGFTCPK